MWTVATGNPWDGMSLHGIFSDPDEANVYAQNEFRDVDWWVVQIEAVPADARRRLRSMTDTIDAELGD